MKKTMILALLAASAVALHGENMSEVVDGVTWYYTTIQAVAYYDNGRPVYETAAQLVNGAEKYAGDIEVPTTLGGYTVRRFGANVFVDCAGLTSIVIPETITAIAGYFFRGCTSLAKVDIRGPITAIENYTFQNCSSLRDVVIPESVTSIKYSAFENCGSLAEIVIPANVSSIGDRVFNGCDNLRKISVAEGNAYYKVENGCLVSANGSTLIAMEAGMESVELPVGITAIPDSLFAGNTKLVSVTLPEGVTTIGRTAFEGCTALQEVNLPSTLTTIAERAFYGCNALTRMRFPEGLTSLGSMVFGTMTRLSLVEFLGPPPAGLVASHAIYSGVTQISCSRKYGAQWQQEIGANKLTQRFLGFIREYRPEVEIVSATIRETDPTVMDVVYKVKSEKPRVKVRALAFQDGERSFAKVVRPTEFIEDTAKNIGDSIAANVEHKISWRVSADWKIDLAKVKFEVLAVEDDLLPLELTTIPATAKHAAMEVSWNVISQTQVFDALLWLYADGDAGLTLTDGVLRNGANQLANGSSAAGNGTSYVLSKMGFSILTGDDLSYVNAATRSSSNVVKAWREVK